LAYLAAVAGEFPADMLVRVYAAVIKTLAIPYNTTSLREPTLVTDARIVRGYHVREYLLRALSGAWPWVIGLALFGLTVHDPRLAGVRGQRLDHRRDLGIGRWRARRRHHVVVGRRHAEVRSAHGPPRPPQPSRCCAISASRSTHRRESG